MEIRNPQYTASGAIDCEIEHPVLGWMPFTAAADDVEPNGREIFALAEAMGPVAYVPPDPAPTVDDYRAAIVAHLDAVAQSRNYDSQLHLAVHATSTNAQWAAEAAAFIAWKDAVWQQVHALWASPPDPVPSPEEVVAGLPVIEWPEVGE